VRELPDPRARRRRHWQFCDIVERTTIPGPTLATPAETERVVLEQHTETGEHRVRPPGVVLTDADDG